MHLVVLIPFAFLSLAAQAPTPRFGFTHQMLPVDSHNTRAVALGDIEGDGDLDVLVGTGAYSPGSQYRLYRNDGAAVFTIVTAPILPSAPGTPFALALGDVDGDGDLDAFVGKAGTWPGGAQNRLYLNGGTGVFTDVAATSLPAVLDYTTAVALGDVDGDGDLDAFVGNTGVPGGQERLYLNGGTGIFTNFTATNLPALLDNTSSVALGDVDGDGDLDAFVGNPGQQNRLLRNQGGGTAAFTDVTATSLPALIDATTAVALGDVDGDGDLDAFVGNTGSPGGQERLYLNGGTGDFTDATATNLPALLDATTAIALRDVDGDGDLDAFVGNYAQQSRLLLNDSTGVFTDITATNLPTLVDFTTAVALDDLDGDGDLDAFLGNSKDLIAPYARDRLFLNDGTGVFREVGDLNLPGLPTITALFEPTRAIALGDVDGDGDLDAFVESFEHQLYLNSGAGVFTDAAATNLPAVPGISSFEAIALGDVDGDGDLDAFLGWGYGLGGQDRLYLNGGTGVFTDVTATNLPALVNFTTSVALGDVDGDGDLDAFLSGADLYVNDGTGVFTDVTATNLPPGVAGNVGLGDLDGDGDLDAFLAWGGQSVLRNLGSGTFVTLWSNSPWSVASGFTAVLSLGDVDGDGDLDALMGSGATAPQQPQLFRNNGTGIFTNATYGNLPAGATMSKAVALADQDDDGDLDAFLSDIWQPNQVYQNNGTGVFTNATATFLPAMPGVTSEVAFGDLDGDGDLDLFEGNGSHPDRILTNLTRQVSWRGIPRAGKPLTLDIRGSANGTWLLAASSGSAIIPASPFGTLRLLPSTLFVVAGGALDLQGRASLSFAVPANPALVGGTLYWQALVGPPLRFSNLEITTVTNL